jgi:hypothetical protein
LAVEVGAMHHRNMATPEEIRVARTKADATRLRNLLRKQAEYSVLNWNEARVLKRLMEKKEVENRFVTESFQFRQGASGGREGIEVERGERAVPEVFTEKGQSL